MIPFALLDLSLGLWLAVIAVTIAEVVLLETESGTAATMLWVAVGVCVAGGWWHSWTFVGLAQHLPQIIAWGAAYALTGAFWSVVKWYFYTLRLRDAWTNGFGARRSTPPDPSDYSGTILMWIAHWPFSLLWTVIHDPITRAARFIFNRLKRTYVAIAEYNFRQS